jgi:hypothetical protein
MCAATYQASRAEEIEINAPAPAESRSTWKNKTISGRHFDLPPAHTAAYSLRPLNASDWGSIELG